MIMVSKLIIDESKLCVFFTTFIMLQFILQVILKKNFSDGFVTGRGCATQEQ